MENPSRLKRELHVMPDFIRKARSAKRLTAAYDARPPCVLTLPVIREWKDT